MELTFDNRIHCRKDGITFCAPYNIISGCELLCRHTCGNYHTLKVKIVASERKPCLMDHHMGMAGTCAS
jgi:hypothetical protein